MLQKICWFLCLAPYGPMQSSLMHATAADKKLSELPVYQGALTGQLAAYREGLCGQGAARAPRAPWRVPPA